MKNTEIKAHIFDAEQSIAFARECVEENDGEGLGVALQGAIEDLTAALHAAGSAGEKNAKP